MLGIEVAESTVGRYADMQIYGPAPPTTVQGWKTFLRNHAAGVASLELFVVRTISFKLLHGLVILRDARRRLASISVTDNPTAEWIASQKVLRSWQKSFGRDCKICCRVAGRDRVRAWERALQTGPRVRRAHADGREQQRGLGCFAPRTSF